MKGHINPGLSPFSRIDIEGFYNEKENTPVRFVGFSVDAGRLSIRARCRKDFKRCTAFRIRRYGKAASADAAGFLYLFL